jgi:hypothetical protein
MCSESFRDVGEKTPRAILDVVDAEAARSREYALLSTRIRLRTTSGLTH